MLMLESLESRRFFAAVAAASPAAAAPASASAVTPAAVASRSVFLTGNSMTDGVSYGGLAELLGRGGTSVTLGRQTGTGYTQYSNRTLRSGYRTSGIDPARPGVTNPWGNYQAAFAARPWDVLTIQPHERRFASDVYNKGTAYEHDEAELVQSMAFLRTMAASNARGQVFVYSRPARRTDVTADLVPTGRSFDYSAEWLRTYDERQSRDLPFFSRSAVQQFMPQLRAAQDADPATAKLPDVRLIPVGEAYYNIDRMIKAGKFAGTGVTSILGLYRDQSHPTPDVAAYVIALSFYSAITGQDPRGAIVPGDYVQAGSATKDPKVRALLQQAVYDAMTASAYAGYTTPLDGTTPPPAPPPAGTGGLRGFCFDDVNRNGAFDAGDARIAGKTVFLDADADNAFDPGETSVITAADGTFAFTNLPPGPYRVRRVFPAGWAASTPSIDVTVSAGQTVSNLSIGARPSSAPPPSAGTAAFRGYVVNDTNANGKWDTGETGVAGRVVWLDADNDATLDAGERTLLTGKNGLFEFTNLPAGRVVVRQVLPKGVRQTSPASNWPLTATLTGGQVKSGQYFATK